MLRSPFTKVAQVFGILIGIVVTMPASSEPATSPKPGTSNPISVELAKKCRALALKVHPSQRPGSKTGQAQAQRDYFNACIAKGGNMPE